MKHQVLGAVCGALAFATVGAAQAADLPMKAPAYVAAAPAVFNWSGFYIGGNVGVAFGNRRDDFGFGDDSRARFAGGGQLGYNWQWAGGFVLGVEADFQGVANGGGNNVLGFNNRIDWFGTVRGRAGFAFDRTLLYATGGYAYGGGGDNCDFFGNCNDRVRSGWTVGGGIEYAFAPNWTARLEGLYVSLDRPFAGFGREEFGVVRVGANYKF